MHFSERNVSDSALLRSRGVVPVYGDWLADRNLFESLKSAVLNGRSSGFQYFVCAIRSMTWPRCDSNCVLPLSLSLGAKGSDVTNSCIMA